MKERIILQGNNQNYLSLKINDILDIIRPVKTYNWVILWIEAVGKPQKGTMIELENTINNSQNATIYSFDKIIDILYPLDQILELNLVGNKDVHYLKQCNNKKELYSNCDVYIKLIDSSFWEITGNKDIIIKYRNL
jgi:hypothetical protein